MVRENNRPRLVRSLKEFPDNGLIFYLNIYNLHRVLKVLPRNSYFTFDGVGLCFLSRIFITSKIQRLAPDFDSYLKSVLQKPKKKILIGGRQGEASEIAKGLSNVIGVTHGFLRDEEILEFMKIYDHRKWDNLLVLIGLGSPRQELIARKIIELLPECQVIVCGAFFSQYKSKEKYYPRIVNKLNLRMPYRLLREGLYSRLPYYFINPFRFILAVVRRRIEL